MYVYGVYNVVYTVHKSESDSPHNSTKFISDIIKYLSPFCGIKIGSWDA